MASPASTPPASAAHTPSTQPRHDNPEVTGAERDRRDRPPERRLHRAAEQDFLADAGERADRHDLGGGQRREQRLEDRPLQLAHGLDRADGGRGPLQPPLDERERRARPRRRRPARSTWRRDGPDARPRTATRRRRSPARLRRPRRAAAGATRRRASERLGGIDQQRDRAVVDELDRHVGAEDAGRDRHAGLAAPRRPPPRRARWRVSGGAASMYDGRRPPRQSPSSVNCETTSTAAAGRRRRRGSSCRRRPRRRAAR